MELLGHLLQTTKFFLKKFRSLYKKEFIVGITIALLLSFGLLQVKLTSIDNIIYSSLFKLKPVDPGNTDKIVLIKIDAKTLSALPGGLTIESYHKALTSALKQKPSALSFIFNERDLSLIHIKLQEIQGTKQQKDRFAQLLKQSDIMLAVDEVKGIENEHYFNLPAPFDQVKTSEAPIPFENMGAKLTMTKRFVYSLNERPLFHAELLNKLNLNNTTKDRLFTRSISTQGYINFKPADSFPSYSLIDVINNNIPTKALKNKIVLIGDTRLNTDNYVLTPINNNIKLTKSNMSKLELQANILSTLMNNSSIVLLSNLSKYLITALMALLTVVFIFILSPVMGLTALLACEVILILMSFLLLSKFDLYFQAAYPLLASFISYYFLVPYRLILENRTSWEYQQQNEILTQVEELKSNFLRMMSHDLKTPLSRIQGMTDIILRNSSTKLSSLELEALQNIKDSSIELNDFVGSILSVGRVESKEVKLELESKDINNLIKDQVIKLSYLAKEKNIKLNLNLEPLFSLAMDPKLITQVLNNIIENAIKYSEHDTQISITSSEINDDLVSIQVTDQGMGMRQEDLESIFLKFYRTDSAQNSASKGSGLGLYLSRYFAELHKGELTATSIVNEGSTFTLTLPTNLPYNDEHSHGYHH